MHLQQKIFSGPFFTKVLFRGLRPTSHLIINFKVGWGEISDFLPGRTDVQCRARWRNHLQPDLVKGPWTKEEDEKVLSLVSQHGPRKWAFIAKHLKGRVKKIISIEKKLLSKILIDFFFIR